MEKNRERIQQIMQLYYEKQQENEELINGNTTGVAAMKTQLLKLKDARASERKSLTEELTKLSDEKELKIREKVDTFLQQFTDTSLKQGIEQKYEARRVELESKITELDKQVKELKDAIKNNTTTSRDSLGNKKNKVHAELRELKKELAELDTNKAKEMESLIPSVTSVPVLAFEKYIRADIEPCYKQKEDEINARIEQLLIETEEELTIKREISKVPNYKEVYLREMAHLKDELTKVLYPEEKNISDRLLSVRFAKSKVAKEMQEKQEQLKTYTENYNETVQKLADVDIITDASMREDLFKKLQELAKKMSNLKSYIENAMDFTPFDIKIKDLENDLKMIQDCRKILEYTKEECAAVMSSMNQSQSQEFYRRNYDNIVKGKIAILEESLNLFKTRESKNTVVSENTKPVVNSTVESKNAEPVVNSAVVSESAKPVVNSAVVSENAKPIVNSAVVSESTEPVANNAVIKESTVNTDTHEFEKIESGFVDLQARYKDMEMENSQKTQEFLKPQEVVGVAETQNNLKQETTASKEVEFILEDVDVKQVLDNVDAEESNNYSSLINLFRNKKIVPSEIAHNWFNKFYGYASSGIEEFDTGELTDLAIGGKRI